MLLALMTTSLLPFSPFFFFFPHLSQLRKLRRRDHLAVASV